MEGVRLKTEPVDETDSIELKIKSDICLNDKPTSKNQDALNSTGRETKVTSKKNVPNKQGRLLEKSTTVQSAGKGVEKKSQDKKAKQSKKSAANRVKKSCVCDECGKEFKRLEHLSRHKLIHSGLRPYICTEENCGAAFRQSSTLKSHRMSHTGERKYFCEECGQGFLSNFQMQAHQRIKHRGERSFVCGECGQGFARKRSLTKHILEHSGNRPFECDECGMRFYEKRLLSSHKKTHTAGGKQFTCAECGKGFSHKTSLNSHQRNHSTVRPFGCEVCGKRFFQKGTLNIHKVIHSGIRPFECEECGLGFTQKFTLKTHRMKQHGLTVPLQQKKTVQSSDAPVVTVPKSVSLNGTILQSSCDNIQKSMSTQVNTVDSMDSVQKSMVPSIMDNFNELKDATEVEQPQKTIKIEETSSKSMGESIYSENGFDPNDDAESTEFEQKFLVDPSTEELQPPTTEVLTVLDHIKEEQIVICEPSFGIFKSEPTTSDDGYMNESDKPVEKRCVDKKSCVESTQRPFSCSKCDRKFALVGALKNHQRSHRRDKKEIVKESFICDECGKICSAKQTLKTHKRIHSDSKPYSCSECGKSFNQLGNMKAHQLTHTGVRPFACETCGKTFLRKDSLQWHKITHTDEKKFKCEICGMKIRHLSHLNRHIKSHTGEKNYGCDICGQTFLLRSYIKVHLRRHTGEKPFACDQCPSRFAHTATLYRHKQYRHHGVDEPPSHRKLKLKKVKKMNDNL